MGDEKTKEIISVLMESDLYYTLTPHERLELLKHIMGKCSHPSPFLQ